MVFYYSNVKFVLRLFLTVPSRMTEAAVSSKLEVLMRRLNEAEKRAKLLKHEIKSINQDIATLIQSTTGIQNANPSIFSTSPISTRSFSNSRTILLDNLPSTSSVDGFVPTKRSITDENEPTSSKKSKLDFNKEDGYVIVYTDGACENNGKANAKAGIGAWFGDNHPLNISKPVNGRATNNTAEIQACVEALRVIKNQGENKVKIMTDSEFTINCMTKWIKNWKKNNWKTASHGDVKNKEDLQVLENMIKTFADVKWIHVPGHRGVRGNEEADKLARQGALVYKKT